MKLKTCPICKNEFLCKNRSKIYCSNKCKSTSRNKDYKHIKKERLTCLNCNADFESNRKKDFCSRKCQLEFNELERRDNKKAYNYERYWNNPIQSRSKVKKSRLKLKNEALKHYGYECAICGESRIEFLCFDHINDDGFQLDKKDRRNLISHLKRNNWPDGIQTLCYNCNDIKSRIYVHKKSNESESTIRVRNLREMVILKYGGKCECCGFDNKNALCIDHIKGNGTKERSKDNGSLRKLLRKLRDEPINSDYRILCSNCNQANRIYGKCFH